MNPVCMRSSAEILPGELRGCESRLGERIGDALTRRRILKLRKAREFLAAPPTHRLCKVGAEVAKERKRLIRTPLFAHEEHGNLRQQQINRRDRADRFGSCDGG